MSKVLVQGAEMVQALCRDAFGNLLMGQEERSLRYIALAIEQLQAVIQCLQDRNDSRKVVALERLTRSIATDAHPAFELFPEIDSALVTPSMKRWHEVEDLPDPLPQLNVDVVPGLREKMEQVQGSGVISLTASQFAALSAPKH